ncbi:MAG TPA: tRNA pseudouridine(55) synthase TruB [Thiobacillaceae bacterium]|nr:tRNA pseudouridine(55) synthase TruB [Thiobacillaceae bacterium]HNU64038.1 tRNA pseudouridine(55) synthase TruB [Thiobacillaceae bacterium]
MKRKVDGVLFLDKPAGLSSNAALQQARRLFNAAKAGHTGTLDPFATGLLPLCLGEATKFSQYLLEADKVYLAEVRFGVRTRSGDLEGDVIAERPVAFHEAALRAALAGFLGEIEQVPPMHSALKHRGRPLYEYARQGIDIPRQARRVMVHALTLEALDEEICSLRVHCGKGFYVRALADDLGQALGCGAHLIGLRRLAVGSFSVAHAMSLTALEALPEARRDACLQPADGLIGGLAALHLDAESAWRMRHGQAVRLSHLRVGEKFRIYAPGPEFLGVAEAGAQGRLAPIRLVAGA